MVIFVRYITYALELLRVLLRRIDYRSTGRNKVVTPPGAFLTGRVPERGE
jgi:hypothetical protein